MLRRFTDLHTLLYFFLLCLRMLAKVSVKVSTFILKCYYSKIHRREVRDEYPSFFCAIWYWEYCHNRLLTIGVLYLCAACHDRYQEGWQQFSCIMVLMMFGILILKSWKVSFFLFSLVWFSKMLCYQWLLRREKEGNMP